MDVTSYRLSISDLGLAGVTSPWLAQRIQSRDRGLMLRTDYKGGKVSYVGLRRGVTFRVSSLQGVFGHFWFTQYVDSEKPRICH